MKVGQKVKVKIGRGVVEVKILKIDGDQFLADRTDGQELKRPWRNISAIVD
jgi:hypothetical protein